MKYQVLFSLKNNEKVFIKCDLLQSRLVLRGLKVKEIGSHVFPV